VNMSEEARSRRASALEEKKRRLEELKARRAAAVASSTTRAPSIPEVGLDEYIDGLLSTKISVADEVAPEQQQQEADSSSQILTDAETKPQEQPIANVISIPQPEAKVHVETFSVATQTEDEELLPETLASSQRGDEGEGSRTGAQDSMVETSTPQEEVANAVEESAQPKLIFLSKEEREKAISSDSFSSFFTTATKKVERLLGAPILADLLVDVNYAGTAEQLDDNDQNKVIKNKWLATGAHARIMLECPLWTKTRTIHDIYWSPIHKELVLAAYDAPRSSTENISNINSNASVTTNELLATLNQYTSSPTDTLASRSYEHHAEGIAVLWSLAMPNRPEHVLIANSPVLSARFHPTEPPLIIGGCYSGQIMLWDIRAGRLPVQKSTLSIATTDNKSVSTWKGHAHPICSLEVAEGGSGLVSASTDGKINFWSLSNLRDPAEFYMLDGNVSCLAVVPESNSILCGDESGGMHSIIVPQSAVGSTPTVAGGATNTSRAALATKSSSSTSSSRRVARKLDVSGTTATGCSSHFGMVTSISTKSIPTTNASASFHKFMSRGFLRGSAGLVLTSGVDWTCKLWAPAYQDRPLLSFTSSSYDYMCDVQWNPVNPTVFAAASSNGVLDFWNLAHSLDEPISGSTGISVSDPKTQAVNKLKWSYDGRRLGIAISDQLHVLGVSEDVFRGKAEDEARMMHHLEARGYLESQF